MPRSSEQSLRDARDYIKQMKRPVSINDMVAANVLSASTIYRLFRPEKFPMLSTYGIVPINNTKPYFFAYSDEHLKKLYEQVNPEIAKEMMESTEVLNKAARIMEANAVTLDPLETKVMIKLRAFREAYDKDEVLADNFTKSYPVEEMIDTLTDPELLEIFEAEPLKFLAFILSTFVSTKLPEVDPNA